MVPLSQCWMFILVHTMNKEVSASVWKFFDVCNQVPALKATNLQPSSNHSVQFLDYLPTRAIHPETEASLVAGSNRSLVSMHEKGETESR